jgi:hypothetical protein
VVCATQAKRMSTDTFRSIDDQCTLSFSFSDEAMLTYAARVDLGQMDPGVFLAIEFEKLKTAKIDCIFLTKRKIFGIYGYLIVVQQNRVVVTI